MALSGNSPNVSCFAKSFKSIEKVTKKSSKILGLELRCPGSISGSCEKDEHNWHCTECEELIVYGFDEYFYCNCGRATANSFRFKCTSQNHGMDFIQFTENELTRLLKQMSPLNEINILILGETGVGKSTWINGFVNYLTFSSLAEAETHEQLSLIGSSFTMTDDNFKQIVITSGTDKNEVFASGQSATQEPKTYVFECGKNLVRLIDTPGIGDTRGIDQDKENFDAILRYLSNLEKLHGICILLKPNNSRLTVMFRFCIKELLTHLHRSASRNIIFCFTNARSTFYRPGDTMPALEKLLEENKDVEIKLSKETVYCMDNESFRFLCAIHHDIKFDDEERKNYSASWDKSVAETKRMLSYISTLTPHVIKDTLSLNDARKIIVSLTIPMADISQNILTNINLVEDKKKEIINFKDDEADLAKKLYFPVVQLEANLLGYPRTVCTNKSCVKFHKIPGSKEYTTEFITHCHTQCYLEGIKPEAYPNPELKNCSAMNSGGNCTKCRCGWEKHMHYTYEQKQVIKQVADKSVENLINSKQTSRQVIEQHIKNLEQYVVELYEEKNTITTVSVQFGCFLKTNSIVPYNDSLGEYLEVLIRQEKDKVSAGADRKTLEGLEKMKKAYNEEVRILNESMSSGGKMANLTPNDINNLVTKLYSLKHKGKDLKKIVNVVLASKSQMMSYQEKHYRPKNYGKSKNSQKRWFFF